MTEREVNRLLPESPKPSARNRGRLLLNQEQSSLETTSVTLCTSAGWQLREDLRFSRAQTTDGVVWPTWFTSLGCSGFYSTLWRPHGQTKHRRNPRAPGASVLYKDRDTRQWKLDAASKQDKGPEKLSARLASFWVSQESFRVHCLSARQTTSAGSLSEARVWAAPGESPVRGVICERGVLKKKKKNIWSSEQHRWTRQITTERQLQFRCF